MDIIDIIFELPQHLLELTNTLKDFLFSTITIGEYTVSPWALLAGVGIVALIIYSIVRS